MTQSPASKRLFHGLFTTALAARRPKAPPQVPKGVGGGLKRSSLLITGVLAAGMAHWPAGQALAGDVNCGYFDIGGDAYVTCVDGVGTNPDGGLYINMEYEYINLDGWGITPTPFNTEDKDATINLGYSDEVGEGLYLETTNSDGVFIDTDDNDITTINFMADGHIIAEYDGIQVTADSDWDGRGDVVINSRGDITAGGDGINVWRTDGAEGGDIADVTITNWGTILAGDDGIHVEADGNVTVTNNGSIGTVANPVGDDGVYIDGTGSGDATVNNTSLLSIHAGGDGVFISDKASATVDNSGGLIVAGSDGIDIEDIGGDVDIDNTGGSITGNGDSGIEVSDVTGSDVDIDNTGGGITGYWDGIDVQNIDGYADIDNNNGGAITGTWGNGIYLYNIGTYVEITNTNDYTDWDVYSAADVSTITGYWDGILIADVGDYVSIDNTDGIIVGTYGDGIDLSNIDGYVEIINDAKSYYDDEDEAWYLGEGGSITGDEHGIVIYDVEQYVNIRNVGGSIDGAEGDGINLYDIDGNVTIDNSGGSITGGSDGIYIADLWTGGDPLLLSITNSYGTIEGAEGSGIYINEIDNGSVDISNYYGSITGDGDEGISVSDVQGGNVTIDNDGGEGGGGTIYGYWDGIDINDVSGFVDITNDRGTITGDYGQGIDVSDIGGNVQITNLGGMYYSGGEIIGNNGSAIRVAGVDGSVTIDNGDGGEGYNGGEIRGEGTYDEAVIHVSDVTGLTTINNQYGGVIRSNDSDPSDVAIRVDGAEGVDGAAIINNSGTIIGQVYLTDNADVFNNASGFSWYVSGDNDFGLGHDVLNNTYGSIYVSGVTNFISLEEFNNDYGWLDLSDDDDSTGTHLTTSGNYYGSGQWAGLALDAELTNNADANADLFTIGGDVTGLTYVYINDVAPELPGAFDPDGHVVIEVGGDDEGYDSFMLAEGPINKGYWQYDLYRRDITSSSEWLLASTPSDQAFELPILMSTAQEAWHQTTGVWLDRQADLRAEAGPVTGGAWAKLIGGSIDRDVSNSYTLYDKTNFFDQSYDQSLFGVMAGVDKARQGAAGETWVFGVLAGFTQSRVDFDSTATDADRDAGSIGAYATYLNGGWFVDAVVKGDIGDTDYSLDNGDLTQEFDLDTTSVGFTLDTGYRVQYGSGFLEPMATLSYVRTSIDDVRAFSDEVNFTDINFSNGDSLRGRIGLRAGTSMSSATGTKYEPFVQASLWNEFDGDNSVTLTSDGMDVRVEDGGVGSYGQVGAGINIFGTNNWTGFAKVDTIVGGDDYDSLTGSLGVRYKW